MRILHAVPAIEGHALGGVTASALSQCLALRSRGHHVELLGSWRGPGPAPSTLETVPLHAVPGRWTGTRLWRWARYRAATFDLAHLHLGVLDEDATVTSLVRTLLRAEVPIVVQTHGHCRPGVGGSGEALRSEPWRSLVRNAAWCLVSDVAEREFVARVRGRDSGISIAPEAVGPGVTSDRVRTDHGRRDHLTGQAIVGVDVVAVAQLTDAKGALDFVEAAMAALELGVDATFTLIGPHGDQSPRIRALIEQAEHLEGLLRYVGMRPHASVVERMQEADIVVVPARDGERSVALLEALAAGRCVICTDATRHALTLRARNAAAICRPTSASLAQAMIRLIDDPTERSHLARAAQHTASEIFNIRDLSALLERAYQRAAVSPPERWAEPQELRGPAGLAVLDRSGERAPSPRQTHRANASGGQPAPGSWYGSRERWTGHNSTAYSSGSAGSAN